MLTLEKIEKRFDLIKKEFVDSNRSVEMIEKAFLLAKELHKNQRRKDGSFYIAHPVEVALILAQLGFD